MNTPIDCRDPDELEGFLRATFTADPIHRAELFGALHITVPIERNILLSVLGAEPWQIRHVARVLWSRSNYADDHDTDTGHAGTGAPMPQRAAGGHPAAHPPAGVFRHPPASLARAGAGDGGDGIARVGRLVQLAAGLAARLAAVDGDSPESAVLIGRWHEFAASGGRK